MRSILRQIMMAVLTILVASSCTKEDMSICYTPYGLAVGISVATGQTDQNPMQSGILYIFDSRTGVLLGQHALSVQDTSQKKVIQLDYPNNNNLTVVCWGNADGLLPEITGSATLSELKIELGISAGYATSPGDIFFGIIEIDQAAEQSATRSGVRELLLKRMVASLVVKTRNLKEWAGTTSNDFHYVVRHTQSWVGFTGDIKGPLVSYRPQATFNDVAKDFTTKVFNVIPSTASNSIEVDIYHSSEVIYTLRRDENGQPIKAVCDKLLNIAIDFSADVAITVTLTPWGEIDQSIIM